jgi:DNA-binding PadR family transcriptional regulator
MTERRDVPLLGEVEQLVLLAVLRLDDAAYANPIRDLIEAEAGVSLFRGSVYVTLERLERKRFVESWFSAPTGQRGGKAKRQFRIRPEGLAALKTSRRAVDRLAAGTVLASGAPRRP